MPDDTADTPDSVAEDVEDLKAEVRHLSAQIKALATQIAERGDDLPDTVPGPTTADGEATVDDQQADEEELAYPPFILLLDPPIYDDELRALIEWVEGVLVPGFLAEPSAEARWCHLWFEHTVAVARLHALWLAWQELTDPATCGYTGPSVWLRDHYEPCMRELRASRGPFEGCTKGEHQVAHRFQSLVPSAWYRDNADV